MQSDWIEVMIVENSTSDGLIAPRRKPIHESRENDSDAIVPSPVVSRIPPMKFTREARENAASLRPKRTILDDPPQRITAARAARRKDLRQPPSEPSPTTVNPPSLGQRVVLESNGDEGPKPAAEQLTPLSKSESPGANIPVTQTSAPGQDQEQIWPSSAATDAVVATKKPAHWLSQWRHRQWNSILLAMLIVAVGYIAITASVRRSVPSMPAPFAMPSVHYHLESPQVMSPLRTNESPTHVASEAAIKEKAESISPRYSDRSEFRIAALGEPGQQRTFASQEAMVGDAIPTPTESMNASLDDRSDWSTYPETEFLDYKFSPRDKPAPTTVRLDGEIHEFK